MKWWQVDHLVVVVIDFWKWKMIPVSHLKVDIVNFVLGHGSWLGCHNKHGSDLAIFFAYLDPMIE
jgi:hypothetical protein